MIYITTFSIFLKIKGTSSLSLKELVPLILRHLNLCNVEKIHLNQLFEELPLRLYVEGE